jgi:DNA helicase-2/ATP-dependent DNA helicase PcrA
MESTVIFGPPGTGKTTRLIAEVKKRVSAGVDPSDIAVVSYTKAAAKEIASRVGVAGVRAQTLHSLSYQLAGIIPDQVFNKEWAREFEKVSEIKLTFSKSDDLEELAEGDAYLALYSYARATLDTDHRRVFMDAGIDGSLQKYLYFVDTYDSFKKAYGVVDFSDMLTQAFGLDPKARILFLDEAQDFSAQQWKLIESWLPFVEEVVVAGDDDQAIYKWSGADPDGMKDFSIANDSGRVVLDQSYRVPKAVHEIANRLIEQVPGRVDKVYKPRNFAGTVTHYGSCNQIKFDPTQDTLILVRNHALRDPIETALMGAGVPYRTEGGLPGPMDNHFVRAIKTWAKAANNYKHMGDVMLSDSEVNNLKRCLHNIYKDRLSDPEKMLDNGLTWDRIMYFPHKLGSYYKKLWGKYGTFNISTNIRISTIHNAKGREADRVVLINGMTDRTAKGMEDDLDSELRTFYVGLTRTREELSIVTEKNPLRQLTI